MKVSFRCKGLTVIDDFVDRDEGSEVLAFMTRAGFVDPPRTRGSIWERNGPINPEVGQTVVWPETASHRNAIAQLRPDLLFPTNTAVDRVLARVKAQALSENLIGDDLTAFAGVIATLYKYPDRSRLVWHSDEAYLGAFALYLTNEWTSDSGGQFAFQESALAQAGLDRIVEPRYGRIIIFKSGIRHSVLPVACASTPRMALSGFFVSHRFVEAQLSRPLESTTGLFH